MTGIKTFAALTAILLVGMSTAYAKCTLPINYDFENTSFANLQGWDRPTHEFMTDEKHVAVKDGKLEICVGQDDGDYVPYIKFDSPYVYGRFAIEYDFSYQQDSKLVSYQGLSSMYDADGKKCGTGLTFLVDKMYLGGINTNQATMPESDVTHHIKVCLNLSEKYYEFYIDGQKLTASNGKSRLEYSGENLSKIGFGITGTNLGSAKIYIDNVRVYAEEEEVYMSPDGNDANPGTFDSPIKSFERAEAMYQASRDKRKFKVYLKSGHYTVPDGFRYGTVDLPYIMNSIIFYPSADAEVTLDGTNVTFSEIADMNINQQLKQRINERISREYTNNYIPLPFFMNSITVNYSKGLSVGFTMKTSSNSPIAYPVTIISAAYGKTSGMLVDAWIDHAVVPASGVGDITVSHPASFEYDAVYKIFIWDEINGMQNVLSTDLSEALEGIKGAEPMPQPSTAIVNNANDIMDIDEKNTNISQNRIVVKGTAKCNVNITVKMLSDNNIVYLRQFNDINGSFSLDCKSKQDLTGTKIYVSGVRTDE